MSLQAFPNIGGYLIGILVMKGSYYLEAYTRGPLLSETPLSASPRHLPKEGPVLRFGIAVSDWMCMAK